MALTKTTTGSLSNDKVDFWIKRALEEHNQVQYIFRRLLAEDTIPAGNGTNIKFGRIPRIVLAGELTEGQSPVADTLDFEQVTATAVQYGQIVEVSDVVQLTLMHDFVQAGMEELAESAARKTDQLIQDTLGAAANVYYGGGKASRVALAGTDVVDTDLLRDILMQLEVGSDGVDGAAPRFSDGTYQGAFFTKHLQDLLDDTEVKNVFYRQGRSDMERGRIMVWSDISFQKNLFGPMFTLEALGTAAGTTGGAYTAAVTVSWGLVRRHKKRGFGEGIDDANTTALGAGNTALQVTMPSDTNYTYDLYASDTAAGNGTRVLVSSGHEASTVVTVTALPTGATIPQAPAAGVTVYRSWVFGRRFASVIDLSTLRTYMRRGSEKSDLLDQKASMGTKWFFTSAILNDSRGVMIEAPSSH